MPQISFEVGHRALPANAYSDDRIGGPVRGKNGDRSVFQLEKRPIIAQRRKPDLDLVGPAWSVQPRDAQRSWAVAAHDPAMCDAFEAKGAAETEITHRLDEPHSEVAGLGDRRPKSLDGRWICSAKERGTCLPGRDELPTDVAFAGLLAPEARSANLRPLGQIASFGRNHEIAACLPQFRWTARQRNL